MGIVQLTKQQNEVIQRRQERIKVDQSQKKALLKQNEAADLVVESEEVGEAQYSSGQNLADFRSSDECNKNNIAGDGINKFIVDESHNDDDDDQYEDNTFEQDDTSKNLNDNGGMLQIDDDLLLQGDTPHHHQHDPKFDFKFFKPPSRTKVHTADQKNKRSQMRKMMRRMGTNRSEKDFIDNYINRSQNNLLFKSDDEASKDNIERVMRDFKEQKLVRGASFDALKEKRAAFMNYQNDSFFSDNEENEKNKKGKGKLFEYTDIAKEVMIQKKHGASGSKRKAIAPGEPDFSGRIRDEKRLQPDDFQRIQSMNREISIDFTEDLRNSSYERVSSIDKIERGESNRAETIFVGNQR